MAKNVRNGLAMVVKMARVPLYVLLFAAMGAFWLWVSTELAFGAFIPAPPFTAVTEQGRPLVGATISVTDSGGSSVPIYANAAGSTTLSTVPPSGVFSFYQAPGTYNVTIAGAGVSRTYQVNIPVASGALADSTFPTPGILRKVSTNNYTSIVVNLAATSAPGVNNDSTEGYSVGSMWVDNTADTVYFCADAAVGAAVWNAAGSSGGITQINGFTGPAILLTTGTNGTSFGIDSPLGNTFRFHLPIMAASSVTSGLLSNTTQTIPGTKIFSNDVDVEGTLIANDAGSTSGIFAVKTTGYAYAVLSAPATDQIGFFSVDPSVIPGRVVINNPDSSSTYAAVFTNAAAGSGILSNSGTGSGVYGVYGRTIAGSTSGAAVSGEALTTGTRAGLFTRSVASATQPIVAINRNVSTDGQPMLGLEDSTATTSSTYAFQYKINGTITAGIAPAGTFLATAQSPGVPSFTKIGDTDTGLGFVNTNEVVLYAASDPVVDCDNTGCAIAPALTINGELQITGVSGTGETVCVKSDGKLGVCSDQPNGSGLCTCG